MRVIATIFNADNGRRAKIWRRFEWGDYMVQFFQDGNYLKEADYFTEDREDAEGTAMAWSHSYV